MRRLFGSLVAVIAIVAMATGAMAEKRVALVIGNGAYEGTGRLVNTVNDADAIAKALESLEFDVTLALDVDRRAAIAKIDAFSATLAGADIAFLFYAGHGMQIGGQNFLLPVDADVSSERALRYSAIDIGEVVRDMEAAARVALIVLDACRDNPYVEVIARSVREDRAARPLQGLTMMELSGRGAIVAYAAAAGEVASDGAGRHSPYTEALLEEIAKPGVEVGLMFRRAAGRVLDATGGRQRPELLVRLVDEVYLKPAPPVEVAIAQTAAAQPEPTAAREIRDGGGETMVAAAEAAPEIVVRGARAEGFFGNRAIHKPAWADTVAEPVEPGHRRREPRQVMERDGNDGFGTAQPVPPGAIVTARISPRGDNDWYVLDVPAAGLLRVVAETPPPNLDLHARLWNDDLQVLRDWQGPARQGGALEAEFALPGPGRYRIQISDGNNDADSPEAFALTFDFHPSNDPLEPNDSLGAARPIPLSARFRPAIFPRGDRDWFSIWAAEPGRLVLAAENVPSNLDVYMRLWNLDGGVIRDWQGPARQGGDVLFEADLAAPGVYVVEMVDGNNDAENIEGFDFSASFQPVGDEAEPNDSFGAAALPREANVQRSGGRAKETRRMAIFPRRDADWLAIDVDHPGELTLWARGIPSSLDVYMRVWNADKDVIRDWVGPLRMGGDVETFADLPRPGRYFVEIVDGNHDASSPDPFEFGYEFRPQPDQYEPNDGPASATPLTAGGEVLFNILPRGDTDWFRVEAPGQGELVVAIDGGPENLDLHYRVWNANREIVRDWVAPFRRGGLTEGFADLPKAGTYFIEVVDGGNDDRSIEPATLKTAFTATGDRFEPNDGFGAAAPISPGDTVRATILPRGDADWFLLEARRAGEFSIMVEEVAENLDIWVRLWDADGNASGWIGPPRMGGVTDARFPVSGTGIYRIEVRDGNNDQRSPLPYRLSIGFD